MKLIKRSPVAPGETWSLHVNAYYMDSVEMMPTLASDGGPHPYVRSVGGVQFSGHGVLRSKIKLDAVASSGVVGTKFLKAARLIKVLGLLEPTRDETFVTIDYVAPGGMTWSKTIKTSAANVIDEFVVPADAPDGDWIVRAIWQGDNKTAAADSETIVTVKH